ncbi:hypothetical protein BS642_20025, partial [Chromobacterium violaceum]
MRGWALVGDDECSVGFVAGRAAERNEKSPRARAGFIVKQSVGGGKRDRTADLLHAMQALS